MISSDTAKRLGTWQVDIEKLLMTSWSPFNVFNVKLLCRLLQEFVEKHESGLQVVYALSGWLKKDPPSYHIRLVSGSKLPG